MSKVVTCWTCFGPFVMQVEEGCKHLKLRLERYLGVEGGSHSLMLASFFRESPSNVCVSHENVFQATTHGTFSNTILIKMRLSAARFHV